MQCTYGKSLLCQFHEGPASVNVNRNGDCKLQSVDLAANMVLIGIVNCMQRGA